MQRFGMVIGVHPDKLEEYKALHAQPWPGVLETLRAHHVSNYSIFHSGELLFAYFEYDGQDFVADLAAMAQDPTTQAWWKLTDPCQWRLPAAREGEMWAEMDQVFFMS